MSDCEQQIAAGRWIDYWLDELDAVESMALEDHLFECAACTSSLEQLAALGHGIAALHGAGRVAAVVSSDFVRRMQDAGKRVREYAVPAQGSVWCTVSPDDDYVVSRLQVSLAHASRIDAVLEIDGDPASRQRLNDLPFDAAAGEVVMLPQIHDLRNVERMTLRVELLAVEAGAERTLGTYTFNHRRSV